MHMQIRISVCIGSSLEFVDKLLHRTYLAAATNILEDNFIFFFLDKETRLIYFRSWLNEQQFKSWKPEPRYCAMIHRLAQAIGLVIILKCVRKTRRWD